MQSLWLYACILLWIGCFSDSMMRKCSFTVFIPSRDVWAKKHFKKTNSKHRSPLWKPFSGCVTAIAETIRGWFPARRGKKKHELNAPSSLSMFGIFGICFEKPHDCQFLIHPASICILCSEYWVAFCWALHCPCSNFYPLVGMPWRPTVEQPEFFLPWAGFGAQPSAIYMYSVCLQHPTPCHPNVRPTTCKTLPRFFGR